MSTLSHSEGSVNANFSSFEATTNSAAYANGSRVPISSTTVSDFSANSVRTLGEVCFNPSVNSTTTTSSMIIKREFQDEESSCTDDSASGLDWQQGTKALKLGERAVDYSMTSPSYSSTDSCAANSSFSSSATRKSAGVRRSSRDDKLSPEEEERRHLRRERNKVAAAKCRQKRVDLTNQLLAETKSLEEEQSQLKETIKSYQQEKEELEFVLEAHRVHCGAGLHPSTAIQATKVTTMKPEEQSSAEMTRSEIARAPALRRPNMIPITKNSAPVVPSTMGEASSGQTPVVPSGIFVLGLQSMINGHTGLTPITGLPSEIAPNSENFQAEVSSALSFGVPSESKLTTL